MEDKVLKLASYFDYIGKEFKKIDMECHDCNMRDMKILEFLDSGKKTMGELAEFMNLTKGSMTTAIDSLISNKYVKREFDENDRRKIYIALLPKGQKNAKKFSELNKEVAKKMLNVLEGDEKNQLIDILGKVCERL